MQAGEALTAVRFDDTGLGVAIGTAGGLVALFDLRAARPTVVKDHMYGQRITDIKFHASGEGGAGARWLTAVQAAWQAGNCNRYLPTCSLMSADEAVRSRAAWEPMMCVQQEAPYAAVSERLVGGPVRAIIS